jgi:hypothetical protein
MHKIVIDSVLSQAAIKEMVNVQLSLLTKGEQEGVSGNNSVPSMRDLPSTEYGIGPM